MEVEEAIIRFLRSDSAVTSLVHGRVHPFVIPQSSAVPVITIQRISGARVISHSGNSHLANPRIQVDTYHSSYEGVKQVAAAVRSAMHAKKITVTAGSETLVIYASFLDNDMDIFESDTGLWRVMSEFRIWHEEDRE